MTIYNYSNHTLRTLLGEKPMPKEACEDLIEKQKLFYTRLCLSAQTDNEAADMKTRVNAMCEAFGFKDLADCMDNMVKTLADAKEKELDKP